MVKKLNSLPLIKSSITTLLKSSLKILSKNIFLHASIASFVFSHTKTPLPAARPSYLTTIDPLIFSK